MKTWQLNIYGIVQGVGFRPNLIVVAQKSNLKIHVFNTGFGVKVLFNAPELDAKKRVQMLVADIPKQARIDSFEFFQTDFVDIKQNQVFKEQNNNNTTRITPDMAWCSACKEEFLEKKNRRQNFSFIACSSCGPRYSLWKKMPFERECTSMDAFLMCASCESEYFDFDNKRRAFSQLNSCSDCNFKSSLRGYDAIKDPQTQLRMLSESINRGELAAVKGIAGFLFVLDYKNKTAIERLRKLKNRPSKPFAIMAKDLAWVVEQFEISPEEANELNSNAAPIVLLKPKSSFVETAPMQALIGNSDKVGVMLAPSAYLYQICKNQNGAVIATSGNISGFPIEFENEVAHKNLSKYTDIIWDYEREIVFPQDDSVVLFTPYYKDRIILRRSRGMAPSAFSLPKYQSRQTILALGSDLKSTFCLAYQTQILVSQYLGKLNTLENLARFEKAIDNLLALTEAVPSVLLIDQHPDFYYKSTIPEKADFKNCEIIEVQHHIAHLAAVMGENDLFKSDKRIVGIVFDGVGYGKENAILGGEFFVVQNNEIIGKSQLPFFNYLMNDSMAIEPRLCYYSLTKGNPDAAFESFYTPIELHNFSKILDKQILTNSTGRVFDALAFCLGFPEKRQSFEGEAALFLNSLFEKGLHEWGIGFSEHYLEKDILAWESVFYKIASDLNKKLSKSTIALKFLVTLVLYSIKKAVENKAEIIAVSGGVFQNPVLLDLFRYHSQVQNIQFHKHYYFSPNDENISFGQLMAYLHLKNFDYIKN